MFSVEDEYGRIRQYYPLLTYFLILLLAIFAGYKTALYKNSQIEALSNVVEKNAVTILYTDINEENLEYYRTEPYCGYKVIGGRHNIDTIDRLAKSSRVISKEYLTMEDTITVSICYSTEIIEDRAQKDLLIIVILFISILILLRRKFAHDKAEYYRQKLSSTA